MMHMRIWKGSLHIPSLFSVIQVTLGSFVNPFPVITQGELEPQFASKDSYFEQNIKQVCRSNWGVIKHPWTSYLSSIISHVPSKKIWKHLGQFGGLDIKTSQEPKLWKNWRIGNFVKFFLKGTLNTRRYMR